MNFIMYGAGSIGRGFIGPLFAEAGYDITFIDVDKKIVNQMNRDHSYHYHIATQGNSTPYDKTVTNIRAIDGTDETAVIDAIAQCDLMATSLGVRVLEMVSPLIAKGLEKRWAQTGDSLDILICENLKDASHYLKSWLLQSLGVSQEKLLDSKCGMIETAIGRMVPVANAATNPEDALYLTVEEYDFLPVDSAAFRGEIPNIPKLVAYDPFSFYEERKLYLHNMGHAICSYLGKLNQYPYISQAIENPDIRFIVQTAMIESCAMLAIKYQKPFIELFNHTEDLLLRFSNQLLEDTCERVSRDPMRKLAEKDRLAGALENCEKYSIPCSYIAVGFAATLFSQTQNEQEAKQIVTNHSKLSIENQELALHFYRMFQSQKSLTDMIKEAEQTQKQLRGFVV